MDIEELLHPTSITAIAVRGYKSLSQAQCIEIRPLTILAGANSSGKSSMMQPVLLLKQTLEAQYDPGALLLDGSNVRITSVDQLLSKDTHGTCTQNFSIECEIDFGVFAKLNINKIEITFKKSPEKGLDIESMTYQIGKEETITIYPKMPHEEIMKVIPSMVRRMYDALLFNTQPTLSKNNFHWIIKRNRCFLSFAMMSEEEPQILSISPAIFTNELVQHIQNIIHLSGLRGNLERTYKTSAVGEQFPGDFKEYVASILYHWQQTQHENINLVSNALQELGLTWKVEAKSVDDTRVELRVGRLTHSKPNSAHDVVSIADVGFGVSQALPIIVALFAARPGQIVYLEQPEIHLHPNAQHKMARLLADAARRGVRVVVETHSSLLLTGIQTLVASGELSPELVKLHWFTRKSGVTHIDSTDLDETGSFGEWPQDFDDVTLRAENAYLNAVEEKEYVAK